MTIHIVSLGVFFAKAFLTSFQARDRAEVNLEAKETLGNVLD